MNAPDFADWYKRHRAAFPSIDTWLAGLKGRKGDDPLTDVDVLRSWAATLRDVALSDALEATARLARRDEEPPRSFDDHPGVVRRIARGVANARLRTANREPRIIDGEYVYDCHLCEDTGMRTIWHSKTVKAMFEGNFGKPFTNYTAVVACGCSRGRTIMVRREDGQGREPMEKFDDKRHCEYERGDEKRLHDFAHRGPVAVAFNPDDYGPQDFMES